MAETAVAPNTLHVVVFLLAHAGSRLPQGFEFVPSELHTAMKELKDSLTPEERARGVLDDLYFSDHTLAPYCSELVRIIASLAAGGIHLPVLALGGRKKRAAAEHFFFDRKTSQEMRKATRLSPDEIALITPLVPRFVRYLKSAVSHGDDSKQ